MNIIETREEIIMRTKKIKREQDRRAMRGLWTAGTVLTVLLAAAGQYYITPDKASVVTSNYGTLALGSGAGAYIIIGILCFLLGIVVTLIAIKRRDSGQDRE